MSKNKHAQMDNLRWQAESALETGLWPIANAVDIFMRGCTAAIEQIMLPVIHGTKVKSLGY